MSRLIFAGRFFCLLALFGLLDLQWASLQLVAWQQMIASDLAEGRAATPGLPSDSRCG